MKLSIVIPVYNRLSLTLQCIESIRGNSYYFHDLEVIIVDDGSDDGTENYFTGFAGRNDWLVYHRNTENLKFAGACNAGAGLAKGHFLAFLNNDIVVTLNWDKILADVLENDPETWMAGAKLLFPDGTIQHAGVYLPELNGFSFGHVYRCFPSDFPPANVEKELQCVTAACIMMRNDEFARLGGFDTGFLNGSEDIDLCLRIDNLGKKIKYLPGCEIIHYESQSEGRLTYSKQNAIRLAERWGNRIKPDFKEKVIEDITACLSIGSIKKEIWFNKENKWKGFKEINDHLTENPEGSLDWSWLRDTPHPVKIRTEPTVRNKRLFLWINGYSMDSSTIKIKYADSQPDDSPGHYLGGHNIRPGDNQILIYLGDNLISNHLDIIAFSKKLEIRLISLSFYSF